MQPSSPRQQLLAGLVHLLTASGTVLGLLVVLAAVDGDEVRALWLSLAALFVDGTDGLLARRLEVKRHLPWFDGAKLDDIVDYLTYVFAPVVLLHEGGYLPDGAAGTALAALPLLVSTYQFCRSDAKTDALGSAEHVFTGFPSYWNIVAFYAVVLQLGPAEVTTIVLVCAVLVFVPVGYLYPSRTNALRSLNVALMGLWMVSCAVLLTQLPAPSTLWVVLSLLYVGYYLVASGYLEVRRRTRRSRPAVLVMDT